MCPFISLSYALWNSVFKSPFFIVCWYCSDQMCYVLRPDNPVCTQNTIQVTSVKNQSKVIISIHTNNYLQHCIAFTFYYLWSACKHLLSTLIWILKIFAKWRRTQPIIRHLFVLKVCPSKGLKRGHLMCFSVKEGHCVPLLDIFVSSR